jgi:hypothetical protein
MAPSLARASALGCRPQQRRALCPVGAEVALSCIGRQLPCVAVLRPCAQPRCACSLPLLRDLRALSSEGSTARSAKARIPAPFALLQPPIDESSRPRGITSLAVDEAGSRLLATTTNSITYMYDTRWCVPHAKLSSAAAAAGAGAGASVAQFVGHRVDSFYVKSAFSPDGRQIVSGSSDHGVYVWDADAPHRPPVVLWGHASEVTAVAWCPTDVTTLVSAADDTTLRVWRVDREGGQTAQRMAEWRRHQPAASASNLPPATPLPPPPPPPPPPLAAAVCPALSGGAATHATPAAAAAPPAEHAMASEEAYCGAASSAASAAAPPSAPSRPQPQSHTTSADAAPVAAAPARRDATLRSWLVRRATSGTSGDGGADA